MEHTHITFLQVKQKIPQQHIMKERTNISISLQGKNTLLAYFITLHLQSVAYQVIHYIALEGPKGSEHHTSKPM